MIKEFEFYHGAVLAKLIHKGNGNVIIKPYSKIANASYVFNDHIGLYIKHSTKRMSPWYFSLKKDHRNEIHQMKKKFDEVFLILVCGDDGIVTLNYKELDEILGKKGNVEWISAHRTPRKEYTVKGADGVLGHKVGKNEFPKKVFRISRIE